jgi:hypothetical protein
VHLIKLSLPIFSNNHFKSGRISYFNSDKFTLLKYKNKFCMSVEIYRREVVWFEMMKTINLRENV